ncbi:MAG: GGDEF domain-containing protein [Clostridia bacterium]|nr:GGDEF domain-containing protein [Clostridia bacterium]
MSRLFNQDESYQQINSYIIKHLGNLWQDVLSGESKAVFLNTVDTEGLSLYLDRYLNFTGQDTLIFKKCIVAETFTKPLFPFLELIKEYLKDKDKVYIKRFIEEAGVYHFQKTTFEAYFGDECSSRYEELIFSELEYEVRQMMESIIKLYCHLSYTMPLVVVIEDIQNARESTLELIKYSLQSISNSRVLFIYTVDLMHNSKVNKNNSYWDSFVEYLENSNLMISFRGKFSSINANIEKYINNNAIEIKKLIDLSRDCLNFLALKQCKEYITTAYNYYLSNNYYLEEDNYISMLYILGDVHNYLQENDMALIYYNSILNYAQKANDIKETCEAYRKIGFIHVKKGNIETATRFAKQGLKLAIELGDEIQRFKLVFLIFLAGEKSRNISQVEWNETFNEVIDLAKKLGMENTLAYCATNPYGSFNQYSQDNDNLFNVGINISQKYKNIYRLAIAYHHRGMVCGIRRNYTDLFRYYEKSEELKKQLGNQLELAYICNGMGYYYSLIAEFEKAHTYYIKALMYLKTVRNYNEIAMTYYNIALNLFFACKYDLSINYLKKILRLLDVLKADGLSYHSFSGIYSLLGVNCLKVGNYFAAYNCYAKIDVRKLLKYPEDSEEYFFYKLFMALFFKEENRYSNSEKCFKQILLYLQKNSIMKKPVLIRYFYEAGLFYKCKGDFDKSKELFMEGVNLCEKLGNIFYRSIFFSELYGESNIEKVDLTFEESILDFDDIMETARLESSLTQVHKEINDINFINALQNIMGMQSDKKSLIAKVMDLIFFNFLVELIFYFTNVGDKWELTYSNCQTEELDFCLDELLDKLTKNDSEKLVQKVANDPEYKRMEAALNSIIYIPLVSKGQLVGNIICATRKKEVFFTYNDLKTLVIASKLLISGLEKMDREREIIQKNNELNEANRKLIKSATTDALTGLYNRHELIRKLEDEKGRLMRYNSGLYKGFSVLFIDLDNFKYYNDTFGHQVGDLILVAFSDLLKRITRNIDFVARFGGDEFIIILTEADKSWAGDIAFRIQNELLNTGQFQQDIEDLLGKSIYVPEEYKLTCSIGISECNIDKNFETEALLLQADKALYLAKRLGKNQYKTWDEAVFE